MGSLSGDLGVKGALVCFRGNSIEVDINDLRSENRIFDVLGCDGAIHLHLETSEIPDTLFGGFPNAGVIGGNSERAFTKQTDDLGGH